MHSLLGLWQSLVEWVHSTYSVNPYVFIALYVISIPPYWWGLWDIARGIYGSVKTKSLANKGLIVRGVIINQLAWFLPYIYVAIVARHLPWYLWVFIAVVVTCSTVLFVIRLRQGRVPGKLPRFLRRRLDREIRDRAEVPEASGIEMLATETTPVDTDPPGLRSGHLPS